MTGLARPFAGALLLAAGLGWIPTGTAGAQQPAPAQVAPSTAPPPADAGVRALGAAAARAGEAWRRHDADSLVAGAGRLLIELPGAAPAPAVGRSQAAALLREFLGGAEEVELGAGPARELLPGRGYVELRRRYRVRGTQEVRTQTVLLGFRAGAAGRWELTELRVLD